MDNCTLSWTSDRGFELDVELVADDVALSMSAVAVPADGTAELTQGVDLFPLDVLFKSQVVIDGEPGQVQQATVRLVGADRLQLLVRVEDVETGEIVPVDVTVAVKLPRGVPERGGPKPQAADEDELDWEDETTLEKLVVEPGDKAPPSLEREGDEPSPKALQALLRALMHGPEETEEVPRGGDDELEDDLEDDADDEGGPPTRPHPGAPPAKAGPRSAPRSAGGVPDDQSMSAEGEARGLLELLVNGDNLELEEDHEIDELVDGVTELLARPWPPEKKAHRLSEWLLEQEAVADLFIGDDDLAEILAQW